MSLCHSTEISCAGSNGDFCTVVVNSTGAPRGFGDLGRMALLFSGNWGALVIILGELGSKLIILWI